jgi:hypothetical protein
MEDDIYIFILVCNFIDMEEQPAAETAAEVQMTHITGTLNGEIYFQTDYFYKGLPENESKEVSDYISSMDKLYPGLEWKHEKYGQKKDE